MAKKVKGFLTGKAPRELKQKTVKTKKVQKPPCEVCGLDTAGCYNPRMPVSGEGRKNILVVAEAPGREEDLRNTQLIGQAGQLCEREFGDVGIDLHEDCWKINAVNCRPPKNRKPSKKEIKCCRHRLDTAIDELSPKFIFLMGGAAIDSFYGGKFDISVGIWRRLCIPDKKTFAWIIPMFHPSFVLRNERDENIKAIYRRDLKFAASCLRRKSRPKFDDPTRYVQIITDFKALRAKLQDIKKKEGQTIAIDFETSGLKPYALGHRIWTASIAMSPKKVISFPVSYPHFTEKQQSIIKSLLGDILYDPRIKKVAHNIPFEDMWSRNILKPVHSWKWCTMNGAHIIDSRSKYSGLKFQAYIHFGAEEYGIEMGKLMKQNHPGTPFNMLDTANLNDLLLYGGFDAHYTYRLFEQQHKILTRKKDPRTEAYKLTHSGLIALNDASYRGINTDEIYYSEMDRKLGKEIETLDKKIMKGKYAKLFTEKTGRPFKIKNKDFSAEDLRTMFFNVLKKKPVKKTAKGFDSVDKDVLATIKHPLAKQIVDRRHIYKMKNTYLSQFLREVQGGKIHPFFHLHTARTYRGSSSGPNFQNIPVRDEEAKSVTRKGIKPSNGNQLLFTDYGSMEVRIAACYTHDPVLIEYINDESTDMHRDEGMALFLLNLDQITGPIRFYSKNQFVFPEIYGSYWVTCARNLWETCMELETGDGITVFDHLAEVLFRGYPKNQWYTVFEEHVKRHENEFWKKFHVTREWQNRMMHDYRRKGYIQFLTGYQRNDLMNRNQVFNCAIQGTAFHCLLWSFIQLNRLSKKSNWASKLIAEIHDENIWDAKPDEREMVIENSEIIMTKKIREHWDWINVPLVIEPEITPVNGAWYYKLDVDKWLEQEEA